MSTARRLLRQSINRLTAVQRTMWTSPRAFHMLHCVDAPILPHALLLSRSSRRPWAGHVMHQPFSRAITASAMQLNDETQQVGPASG